MRRHFLLHAEAAGQNLLCRRVAHRWLRTHRASENEVWINIHKVNSGLASITPKEAIDVVLCWGWIDAVRKAYDDKSYLQRYTPRGKKSIWSQINVANVARLAIYPQAPKN